MGMINRMAIEQMIYEADQNGADPLLLEICRELLSEIEQLEEKTIGVEA